MYSGVSLLVFVFPGGEASLHPLQPALGVFHAVDSCGVVHSEDV